MKKNKIIFLTGGVRSGKSSFALKLAQKIGKNVVFIATCAPKDKEMKKRIGLHKQARPKHWGTIEAFHDLAGAVTTINKKTDVVIIDCITLFLSNLMMQNKEEKEILGAIEALIDSVKKAGFSVVIVTNEVGWGIVPANKLARDFRDIAGKANQLLAKNSDEAYIMVSGIALKLK